ncbi:MAG: helix-turn-helix domain-containing protein [Bacillus sp. (in: firmicutes)]
MDYDEMIKKMVDYIDEHIDEQLSLQKLAETAGFSPYHFHRIFHSLTGETVMEFVRKRRFYHAARLLHDTERRIIDIALDAGFQSHESFARAFKRFFGSTPKQYRASKNSSHAQLQKVYLSYRPLVGGTRMEPKIISKPAFHIVGYSLKTTATNGKNRLDVPAFWQAHLKKINSNNPPIIRGNLGICTDFDTDDGEFTYLIADEVALPQKAPESMVSRSFPAQEFAVFTTPAASEEHFSSTIQTTWDYIFTKWFPGSIYEHAGTFEYELYDERSLHPDNKQIDIYVPIKKQA